MGKYRGDRHVVKTKRYRLKTSAALTEYVNSLYSESHMWINAGCEARRYGVSTTAVNKIAALVREIPYAFARGAILEGMKMDGTHIKYGEHRYPLFNCDPLTKRSSGSRTLYLPHCDTGFELQKGTLPKDSQSYKLVDVSNHDDRERQFELHVVVREHVPPRVMTGVSAGIDLGGRNSATAVLSDGAVMVLTLREGDVMRKIAKLHEQMSKCKKNSCKYGRLRQEMKSIYKKLGNRQLDKMRKFNNKLLTKCDRIVTEGMNLQKLTTEGGNHKKNLNKLVRQSRPGAVRNDLATRALAFNVQYNEINQRHTSDHCCRCGGGDTYRKGRFFKCHVCGNVMHSEVNAGHNILYNTSMVRWSKRAQNAVRLYDKAGLVLRDKIHLGNRTTPPVAGDWSAGTGGPRRHHMCTSLNAKATENCTRD